MKILITGATGFVGKNLINILQKQKYQISIIVRKSSDIIGFGKNIDIYQYNSNIKSLIKYFDQKNFDGVVHLASLFLYSHSPQDICGLVRSNIEFGTEILEASNLTKVKWFINTGTFWQHFLNEKYNPVNLYAATKQAFEDIIKYYVETSNLIITTIKLNDTFGENDNRSKIINLLEKISKTDECLNMSEGNQIMNISYIEDVVSAYDILIKHLNSKNANSFNNNTFVVSASQSPPLKDLVKIFEETIEKKLNINWGERKYRKREVMNPWNKGIPVPGWKQQYSLENGIRKTLGLKK